MSADPKWHTFSPSPFSFFTKIFVINKDEFIATSKTSIFIFNQQKNEWNKIYDYKEEFGDQLAYDETNQVLYLCNTKGKLLKFDVKSRKLSLLTQMCLDTFFSQLIFAENKLHKIDDFTLNVYDDIMKQFKRINEQRKLSLGNEFPIIYLKSQKCLLSFGAFVQSATDHNYYSPNYSLYQFSFLDKKWTELDVEMPFKISHFGLVKSKNERYVIQFGGETWSREGLDDIFIYNTRKHLFTKSKIKCPFQGRYYGIITNDIKYNEILCFGFVNDSYKGNNFKNIQSLPFYLIKLINGYFCHEELHLFQRAGVGHWKINIDHILQS